MKLPGLPVMVCNAIMAAGMASLAGLIEGGMSHRDAVAKMFKDRVWGLGMFGVYGLRTSG